MTDHQLGIKFDIRGVVHRACTSCGGVTHPDMIQRRWYHRVYRRCADNLYVDNKCGCGTEPEIVQVGYPT